MRPIGFNPNARVDLNRNTPERDAKHDRQREDVQKPGITYQDDEAQLAKSLDMMAAQGRQQVVDNDRPGDGSGSSRDTSNEGIIIGIALLIAWEMTRPKTVDEHLMDVGDDLLRKIK